MDSRYLPNYCEAENQEPNAILLYIGQAFARVTFEKHTVAFEFYRFRFHFRAIDAVHFPPGKSGNVVRGSFGMLLRDTVPPEVYGRLFEPGAALGKAPSGLGDWPRPFILRASHLDGLTIPQHARFHLDLHVFDLRQPALASFRAVFTKMAAEGLGPGRGRAVMEGAEQLDLEDRPRPVEIDPHEASVIAFESDSNHVPRVRVRFQTPTELKSAGAVSARPEFAILFARLRDRISTLRSLYGPGPLDIDFREIGERAKTIRLRHCDLRWERVERKSGRTGQVHPLGGFTGVAEYEGELAQFLPWLRAARWVGVGRQTVWGKGDVRVVGEASPAG